MRWFIQMLSAMMLACSAIATESTDTDRSMAQLRAQVADVERAFAKTMTDRDSEAFAGFLSNETVFLSATTERDAIAPGEDPVLATALDGAPLRALPRSAEAAARLQANLDVARARHTERPDETNTIWLGRRLAYLNRYDEAIAVFSDGLARFPDSYRLLRHRGHRYISTRRFELAIADFKQAYARMPKGVTETEPDGIPNRLNQPLSNTQFNVLYHWGLTHYLRGEFDRAAQIYRECLQYSPNDDLRVATVDWLWMALRRIGSAQATEEAARLLVNITPDMEIIENDSYLKRLLFYKGELKLDALMRTDAEDASLALATQGYGVANWHFVNGHWRQARTLLDRVRETGNWPAFGYIAAEADAHRGVPDLQAAEATLDALHQAASDADWDRYFSLYHPTARFLGTDAGEDWDMAALRRYALATDGWTFTPRSRSLYRPTPDVVMFHELLDNATYGTSRGSGALVWTDEGLKVTQYHLTFPMPNALADELTGRIREYEATAQEDP
jgi:tetratricopeptide (TPR) repeat protein